MVTMILLGSQWSSCDPTSSPVLYCRQWMDCISRNECMGIGIPASIDYIGIALALILVSPHCIDMALAFISQHCTGLRWYDNMDIHITALHVLVWQC